MEWVYENRNKEINPLMSKEGQEEIKKISDDNCIDILGICADILWNKNYFKVKEKIY